MGKLKFIISIWNHFLKLFSRSSAGQIPNYSFQIGVDVRNQPNAWTHVRSVNSIIMHPSYNRNTFANDVALMRLSV